MPKVILLDDDEDILELVALVLGQKNLSVITLSDPQLLFGTLKLIPASLIIMDINMGMYDGRNLCKKLKTDEAFKNVPVILYSAGDITPDSIEESLADDFLQKPFDINKLYSLVDAHIAA